ncbi:hypothetical protein ElyMa_003396300 [Elysia marginata]|uniref:Putative Dachshund-homology domain-containing protein n=1 Tax=Elysia marginata TaxID=1093978 RepID=A0AAV4JQD4_9GAST|nr:hypothetical protein ElyMa_003396300 [Elysia marginata]
MDFNPLDILAAAALGEEDATPELKNSEAGQPDSSGQIPCTSHLVAQNDKLADDEKEPEMGKSGSNSLKRNRSSESGGQAVMAPQKTPWSPDSLLSLSPDSHPIQTNAYCIDELVKDIKTKSIDMELKNIIGKSFPDDNCLNHNLIDNSHDMSFQSEPNDNYVAVKNKINSSLNKDPSKSPLKLMSDLQKTEDNDKDLTSADDKSVDSGVSGGEFSPASDSCQCETWALDHSYAMVEGHTSHPSVDNDDIDVCSDLSPSTEDTEQRSQNMALDCNYLKSGIMEGVSASTLDLYGVANSLGRSKLPSSSSSASSPTADLSSRSYKSVLDDNENCHFPELAASGSNSASTSPNKTAAKYGKFKIGTFASFSTSNLELEKYLKDQEPKNKNHRKLNVGIPSDPLAVEQTLGSSSLQPLLQSPSLDWDRSEAASETQEDSSDDKTPSRLSPDLSAEKVTEWSHPLFHDHDYCSKDANCAKTESVKKVAAPKRKYTKRKSKLDVMNHEKILKAKYLKKELLKQDSFLKKAGEPEVAQEDSMKSNPVGRPRKKTLDKVVDEEIDPETGTKMKITGKFQDQYVYYLSKSSRTTTRRRQTPALPIFQDKILVPAPKPGDIVVHHLTDSDIETVRQRGRGALNLPERPNHTSNLPTSTISSLSTASPPFPSQSNDNISDVDIVSTILSMENDNLSSPTTSHAPTTDLSSTAGINPHQPALTESLRQLSGDSSLSSEHVLNYLISVVKEENLLEGGNGFDTSSSALFPSIPPDAIYSKADNSDNNSSFQGPYQYAQSAHKNPMDGVDLPDDFTSLLPNSQESSSGSSQHDVYSNNSLKNVFGSDVSSLEASQLSSSVPRLTSIEKTLDYLGVKDGEIKLDSNGYSNPFGATLPINEESHSTCPAPPDPQTDETPWIVTVTLYFNDVPAIMVNNEPFIRLVDIHKQILPAKDTGILKKRCQLLNIPVLNCSEMQRYFLVQYGRAYNSKSTLIISKDQATKLVTYYATPQPRVGKIEDTLQQRSGSCGSDSKPRSPVTCPQSGVVKRKGLPKSTKKPDVLIGGGRHTGSEIGRHGFDPRPSQTKDFNPPGVWHYGHCAKSGLSKVVVLIVVVVGGGGGGVVGVVIVVVVVVVVVVIVVVVVAVLVAAALLSLKEETHKLPPKGVRETFIPENAQKLPKDETEASQIKRTRHKKVNYLEMLKGEEKIPSEDSILETIEAVVKSAPDYVRAEKSRSKKKKSKKSRREDSTHEKRVKGSSKTKSSKKKRDKKSEKHGHKDRHHASKTVSPEHALVRPVTSACESEWNADLTHKKFKPLKLKVNSLLNFSGNKRPALSSPLSSPAKKVSLFSRSNSVISLSSSVTSPTSPTPEAVVQPSATGVQPPPRILAVAHQPASALPAGESRLPSQPADIHLDLFTRPSSACVQCRTCSQFLSVPHFMRHHHVPMDNQWLASEAAHRILVPLASTNDAAGKKMGMSEAERRLWEEFHRLQEAIGGFGEGDDESDSDVDFTEDDEDAGGEMDEDEDDDDNGDQDQYQTESKVKQNKALHPPPYHGQSCVLSTPVNGEPKRGVGIIRTGNKSVDSAKVSETYAGGDVSLQVKKKAQPSEASLAKIGLVRREPSESAALQIRSQVLPVPGPRENLVGNGNVRHSSRRRKSKQFFSIENYDTIPQDSNSVHNSAPYG